MVLLLYSTDYYKIILEAKFMFCITNGSQDIGANFASVNI